LLLENGGQVNARNILGNTPLHGNFHVPEIARLLLENGAQVNARNNVGMTPLHKVLDTVHHGRSLENIQELIRHGADLLATDGRGRTPFDIANFAGATDYILTVAYRDQLVNQEGNRAIHAILETAEYRYVVVNQQQQQQQQRQTLQIQLPVGRLTTDQFRALLRSFGNNFMSHADNTGAIPFHTACRNEAPVEILDLLLHAQPGALTVTDNSGFLPLHSACRTAAPVEILKFLLQRDPASVQVRDNAGALPLHRLCGSKPTVDAVELLLKAFEGSISVRMNNGDLPLMVAYKTRASLDVCLVLLRAYPDALGGCYNPK